MVMNVSLDTANINVINISTLDFRIWQHFSRNCALNSALNGRLKGWKVIVSSLHWQQEFLYPDHWPLKPKSTNTIAQMACDKT